MSNVGPTSVKVDEFETPDWKLDATRKFFRELLGMEIGHFVIAFSNQFDEKGVIASSPNAIRELIPLDIYAQVAHLQRELGRKIIRKEVDPPPFEP